MALSALARLVRRNAFAKFETGEEGPKTSARLPAKRGRTRGSLGSLGSRAFAPRNPDAAEDRERQTLGSPIMQAFMHRLTRFQ